MYVLCSTFGEIAFFFRWRPGDLWCIFEGETSSVLFSLDPKCVIIRIAWYSILGSRHTFFLLDLPYTPLCFGASSLRVTLWLCTPNDPCLLLWQQLCHCLLLSAVFAWIPFDIDESPDSTWKQSNLVMQQYQKFLLWKRFFTSGNRLLSKKSHLS
jgi:hypothetical protein